MNQRAELRPGTEMEGGYFAGVVIVDGKQYGVVVAPKAEGEFVGPWGARGKRIGATHLSDGVANTQAMAESGSEIAKKALALTINGHADWYVPARDELELIYRHLKPGTSGNFCSFRDGENPNSVPPGQQYTDDSPGQTAAEAFRDDGQQAMEAEWYWSSTQYSAGSAFIQEFAVGTQSNNFNGSDHRVRAVRRVIH